MATQFERTTISLTHQQMAGVDKLIEEGQYPDRTEAIRASVNILLTIQKYPTLWHLERAMKQQEENIREQVSAKLPAPAGA